MVGGPTEAFARAKPILEVMGKTIVHAGGPGNGQAAKICNNMILGASMIAVCEAFVSGGKAGAWIIRSCSISAPNPRASAGR